MSERRNPCSGVTAAVEQGIEGILGHAQRRAFFDPEFWHDLFEGLMLFSVEHASVAWTKRIYSVGDGGLNMPDAIAQACFDFHGEVVEGSERWVYSSLVLAYRMTQASMSQEAAKLVALSFHGDDEAKAQEMLNNVHLVPGAWRAMAAGVALDAFARNPLCSDETRLAFAVRFPGPLSREQEIAMARKEGVRPDNTFIPGGWLDGRSAEN